MPSLNIQSLSCHSCHTIDQFSAFLFSFLGRLMMVNRSDGDPSSETHPCLVNYALCNDRTTYLD